MDFHTIARMAAGASGAELANIINEAALRAVRQNRTVVTEADLEESIETVGSQATRRKTPSSPTRKSLSSPTTRSATPWWRPNSPIPLPCRRSPSSPAPAGALGYTMQVDTGEKNLLTKEELENKIATLTGGRAAEEVGVRLGDHRRQQRH